MPGLQPWHRLGLFGQRYPRPSGCQDSRGDPHLVGRDLARRMCPLVVVARGTVSFR